jgi:hypothetical protein
MVIRDMCVLKDGAHDFYVMALVIVRVSNVRIFAGRCW